MLLDRHLVSRLCNAAIGSAQQRTFEVLIYMDRQLGPLTATEMGQSKQADGGVARQEDARENGCVSGRNLPATRRGFRRLPTWLEAPVGPYQTSEKREFPKIASKDKAVAFQQIYGHLSIFRIACHNVQTPKTQSSHREVPEENRLCKRICP